MKDRKIISEINKLFRWGERRAKALMEKEPPAFNCTMEIPGQTLIEIDIYSSLYEGDNLDVMRRWIFNEDIKGKIKLFYIDPPFFTMSDYNAVINTGSGKIKGKAYKDSWDEGMREYIKMLYPRIYMMREIMADDGLIFCHVDWHAAHFVRLMLDDIFGRENFVNEIIWQYKSGGSSKKHFARKHDNIFIYSKTGKYQLNIPKEKSYNRGLKPYRFKGVEEFQDDIGWYTLVNMKDVWEIDMVGRTSGERTGYATQKPEQLMERIIEAASSEGDLVADPFCGSGSFGVAAVKHGRGFLMADSGPLAIETAAKRLIKEDIEFLLFEKEKRPSVFKADIGVDNIRVIEAEDFQGNMIEAVFSIRNIEIKNPERHFSGEALRLVEEKIKSNPLELIDHWYIGLSFDGSLSPDYIFTREKGRLVLEQELSFEDYCQVGIRVVDIFGNAYQKEFDLR